MPRGSKCVGRTSEQAKDDRIKARRNLEELIQKAPKYIIEKLRYIPDRYKFNYLKVINGKRKSLAVKINCIECCGWSLTDARNCDIKTCCMFPYKPKRTETKQSLPETQENDQ